MKLTSTGKWLLDAFLDKEPHGDDRELGAVVDVLQSYEDSEVVAVESGFKRAEEIAVELNLLTK